MTAQTPPYVLQAGSHSAELFRRVLRTSVPVEGVHGAGSLKITQKSGTANMSVDVAAGEVYVHGTENAAQGTYYGRNDAVLNLAIAAADATNPRKDIVVARVRDSAYSGATDSFAIEVVTGTPAASPAEPALPANSLKLATVDVAAGATSITNANITDRRVAASTWSKGRGRLPNGLAKLTSNLLNQSGASPTDIGVSVTVTTEAGREYRIVAQGRISLDDASTDVIEGYIREGSTILGKWLRWANTNTVTNRGWFSHGEVPDWRPAAGGHTVKLSAQNISSSTRTWDVAGSSDEPVFLYVEDLGGYLT